MWSPIATGHGGLHTKSRFFGLDPNAARWIHENLYLPFFRSFPFG